MIYWTVQWKVCNCLQILKQVKRLFLLAFFTASEESLQVFATSRKSLSNIKTKHSRFKIHCHKILDTLRCKRKVPFGISFSFAGVFCFRFSKVCFLLFSLFLTMPRLSLQQRQEAIGMLLSGQSIVFVAHFFGFCRKTIRKLQDRYQNSGSVVDNARSGRPGLWNNEARSIFRIHRLDPMRPAAVSGLIFLRSRWTIARILKKMVWWPEDLKKALF